jgi:hypothetical protein
MDEKRKALFDKLEVVGYLPEMRKLVMRMATPFWWFGIDETGRLRVFHNGTITVFHSGVRLIGVTADHVYEKYLSDKARLESFGCQFGGATAEPEKWLIDRSRRADLATFEIPNVILGLANLHPHYPVQWPTEQAREREVVIYGGYPGSLREEKGEVIETPFETLASAITSVSTLQLGLHIAMANLHWPFHEGEQINAALGGMSGGGVYRVVAGPVERIELIGIIYEHSEQFDLMFARHARFIDKDGAIHFDNYN